MIRELLFELFAYYKIEPEFEPIGDQADALLERAGGNLDSQMTEYLRESFLSHESAFEIEFHGLGDLIEENRDLAPGAYVIDHGFICFAKDGDGSQFAYSTFDAKIYHLGFDVGNTREEIVEKAWADWPDFESFLRHKISILRDAQTNEEA